jgi:hypothetical protein
VISSGPAVISSNQTLTTTASNPTVITSDPTVISSDPTLTSVESNRNSAIVNGFPNSSQNNTPSNSSIVSQLTLTNEENAQPETGSVIRNNDINPQFNESQKQKLNDSFEGLLSNLSADPINQNNNPRSTNTQSNTTNQSISGANDEDSDNLDFLTQKSLTHNLPQNENVMSLKDLFTNKMNDQVNNMQQSTQSETPNPLDSLMKSQNSNIPESIILFQKITCKRPEFITKSK